MQNESVTRHRDARAEAGVVAVDPGDHVTFGIRGRQHDGVAAWIDRRGDLDRRGMLGIDLGADRLGMRLRQQHREGHFHEIRVGVVAKQVRIGELLGLHQEVPVFRASWPEARQRLPRRPFGHAGLEDIEHHIRAPGLRGRRRFVAIGPAIDP